jgi:hypothetical protein
MASHFVDAGALSTTTLIVLMGETEFAGPARIGMGGAGDVVGRPGRPFGGANPRLQRVGLEGVIERYVDVGRRAFGAVASGEHDGAFRVMEILPTLSVDQMFRSQRATIALRATP